MHNRDCFKCQIMTCETKWAHLAPITLSAYRDNATDTTASIVSHLVTVRVVIIAVGFLSFANNLKQDNW